MDAENDDHGFDEEVEKSWREYLPHWKSNIYPMFEEIGISADAAIQVWYLNRLRNAIEEKNTNHDDPWS